MNLMKNRYKIWIWALAGCLFCACSDERDAHYERSEALPEENLMELMSQHSDLSIFTQLVKIAAYDSLLTSNQTFTVWAPVNESFSDVDLNTLDREQARLIAGNHIARFNHSTSTAPGKSIRMIDKKMYTFADGGASFGNAHLVRQDMLAKNGLLHSIDARILYQYNLYEYILSMPQTSKLAAFVRSFDEELFDESLSLPIDVDANGQTVYDTVTVSYNRLFDNPFLGLGQINREDSLYTMIIPDNDAWDAAYARISPYFRVYHASAAYADSVRDTRTSLAILENLIYRGRIDQPALLDSLVSTAPSVISNPSDLFYGSVPVIASNGIIFQTPELRYDNTETWNKNIMVESDIATGRTIGTNTTVYTQTVTEGEAIPVSDYRYIEVQATSPTTQPSITFELPDILAGPYDLYVEFIPGSISGMPNDSTKLMFELTYANASGRPTSSLINSASLVTSGTQKVKMKVLSQFEFSYSNCYDRLWQIDYLNGLYNITDRVTTNKLMIRTNVTAAEMNNNIFSRRFRIDRIILEAVRR
jgi:hypothetical protein